MEIATNNDLVKYSDETCLPAPEFDPVLVLVLVPELEFEPEPEEPELEPLLPFDLLVEEEFFEVLIEALTLPVPWDPADSKRALHRLAVLAL